MPHRNDSSTRALLYLMTLLLSVAVLHVSAVISKYYHKTEIRNIDKRDKPVRLKERKKRIVKKKANPPVVTDTSKAAAVIKDTSQTKAQIIGDEAFFTKILDDYKAQMSEGKQSQSRPDIVIRYYKKTDDGDRVYKLRELGFYIHERPAKGNFDEYASNAIFYGDSVRRDDLMLIAYSLINSGLKLQNISLSKFHDTWKAHSIEIGTDTTKLNAPVFTLDRLRKKWGEM